MKLGRSEMVYEFIKKNGGPFESKEGPDGTQTPPISI